MTLKRTLTIPLLTFYGLGSIIGAGIYALIGSVANEAHFYTPFAFLIAAIIAFFTALTYAELSARFPVSAGSALYAHKAFNISVLSGTLGWMVIASGAISSAALVHGLINYINYYWALSPFLLIPVIIIILGMVAVWGITESVTTIFVMSVIEIMGLLIIIWYGRQTFGLLATNPMKFVPSLELNNGLMIVSGAILAFYAFLGFEDMVNVAEETKNPEITMPISIILAAIIALLLYSLISFVTVASLNHDELASSKTPLALIIQQQNHSPLLFNSIAMISITNGILVNLIMASRLIYGIAKLNYAPKIFTFIYEKTKVPLYAIIFVMLLIIILAFWFPIEKLATFTSFIMLLIFSLMHIALIKIKMTKKENQQFNLPIIFPWIGLSLSVFLLIASVANKLI